jgi:DNA polymerase-3 subunit epsilon
MKLANTLVVLDVESTGIWIEKDRIIEIALVKFRPGGEKETYETRLNPGMPIPTPVTDLTGIRDEDVRECPCFRQVAHEILDFLGTADLAGFNVERFDLPLLEREFSDVGIKFEWQGRKIYDAQKVFHLNEKRDLSAAYQFYCGKALVGAHSALADSEAVYDILAEQVKKYGEGAEDLAVLDKFEYSAMMEYYDEDRKFCWWNGKLYPTFGKYRRKMSLDDMARRDTSYLQWLLKSDFKEDVRSLIEGALKGEFPERGRKKAACGH